jgi:hypothetical protein
MSKLQPIRRDPLPRRNDPCPCGSGKKAKKCCLKQIELLASIPPAQRESFIVVQILGHPIDVLPAPAISVETTEQTTNATT